MTHEIVNTKHDLLLSTDRMPQHESTEYINEWYERTIKRPQCRFLTQINMMIWFEFLIL